MIEKTMEVDRMEDVISVFGSFDQNLRMIETEYNVRVTDRDEQIHITGEAENVLYAEKAIAGLLSLAAKGEEIGEQNVRYIFRLVREGREQKIQELAGDVVCITAKGKPIKAKTLGQRAYLDAIEQNTITLGVGPAGTGKTYLAVAEAVAAFRAEHPNVTYSIYSGNSDNIKERIERGTLDIGLLLEPVEISKYDFLHFPVPETWNALVRSDSPLAQKPYLTPQDIVPYPAVFSRRDQIRSEIVNWFGDSADRLNIIAHGDLQYNMASVIRRENGVLFTLKLDLQHNGLKFVPLQPPIRAATVLVWKKEPCALTADERVSRFCEEIHFRHGEG